MVKRVSKKLLADGEHNALEHVFEHIGVSWPAIERKKILQSVIQATFPDGQAMYVWEGSNLTHVTSQNEPYYPVTVSLKDSPRDWFKNLRILQIRKKLCLVKSLRVSLAISSCVTGEVNAKIKSLEEVVGKEMVNDSYIPKMRKPRMMTTRNRQSRDRIENLKRPCL